MTYLYSPHGHTAGCENTKTTLKRQYMSCNGLILPSLFIYSTEWRGDNLEKVSNINQ